MANTPNLTGGELVNVIGVAINSGVASGYNELVSTQQISNVATVVSMPTGFNWPQAQYPITVTRAGTTYGSMVNTTFVPESYMNPLCAQKVYHVAPTAAGTANGIGSYTGDFTNAMGAINAAITAGNATNAPYTVLVKSGTYYRTFAFDGILPTQDTAFLTYGGRVICGPFDNLTWAVNGTFTNTYSVTRSNATRVFDTLNTDGFGDYAEIPLVASATLCNTTPNSWYTDGTTVYVRRGDGAAVTASNTRVYLTSANNIKLSGVNNNFYINGFDLEGGGSANILDVNTSSYATGNLICVNCTLKYASNGASGGNAATIDGRIGLVAFVGCTANLGASDGFNFHWTKTTTPVPQIFPLLINCIGKNNGLPNNQSCNGYTFHDGIIGIDIAGDYQFNYGGNVAMILGGSTANPTQLWCVGTRAMNSRGDVPNGGVQNPRDFWIDGIISGKPSTMWLDGCEAGSPPSATLPSQSIAATNSALAFVRNTVNTSNTSFGTIASY